MLRGGSLGRSLAGTSCEDRLSAAWTVICGRALAGRAAVAGYAGGVVRINVADSTWLAQLAPLRGSLTAQLREASGIPVQQIEFAVRRRQAS